MASTTKAALQLLRTNLPGLEVTTAADDTTKYEADTKTPWSQTCWTPAAAYVHPRDAQQVATALKALVQARCKFALRTTGHNPNVGFSSVGESGVVLDLRRLQSRELGHDGVARVGAGSTWGEVYTWLEEQGLCAVGGRDQQVGLAGFLLGGGLGGFPNVYGLGGDGVRNFEVALSDGSIVNANAQENPDLFRVLKCGGSNYGVVTRFDIETHPLMKVQHTIQLYKPEDYVNIAKATAEVQQAMEDDPKLGLFTNFNAGFVAVGLLYADWPESDPEAFQPFHNLTSLMTTAAPKTNGTLLSLAQTLGHAQDPKKRICATASTGVSQDLYAKVYETWQDACKALPEGAVLHYTIQPVGSACVRAGKDRGGNIMGLEEVPQCWWVFTCEWAGDESADAAAAKAVELMANKTQDMARESGDLLSPLCMSFAAATQNVLASYGPENLKAMKEAAAKYDPEGVFQKLQNGGFLLRDAA